MDLEAPKRTLEDILKTIIRMLETGNFCYLFVKGDKINGCPLDKPLLDLIGDFSCHDVNNSVLNFQQFTNLIFKFEILDLFYNKIDEAVYEIGLLLRYGNNYEKVKLEQLVEWNNREMIKFQVIEINGIV